VTALLEFQRTIASAVMQPLTSRDTLRRPTRRDEREAGAEKAIALVKPNSRLSSLERLEIYSRSYWSRVLDALGQDFPGVRAVLGARRFDRLRRAYLADCSSESFTMRNLGRRLPAWMEHHAALAGPNFDVATDMAKLEWAQIESFDAAECERLSPAEIAALDAGGTLHLQPHLRWMQASSEVDSLLLEAQRAVERTGGKPRGFAESRIARNRSAPTPLYLAIHRQQLVVHFKRIDAEMFRLLEALARPAPVGEALEFAYAEAHRSSEECRQHVEESFALFASLGWFCNSDPAIAI
jgi:hypothetical protein